MRIVSMLPSATEILFAIGAGDQVVGVTFECDYPRAARSRAQVVQSHLPPGLTPAAIDAIVRAEGAAGRNLYFADMSLLQSLAPDLIVVQDLCRVCAIDSPTLARDLRSLPSRPDVLSLSAHTLDGIFQEIQFVGTATGCKPHADHLVQSLQARLEQVRHRPPLPQRPTVLCLEWLDPLFQGGHWVPEMVSLAGGEPVLAEPGKKSVRLSWQQVQEADPDVIVLMPCGYDLAGTKAQYASLSLPPEWYRLRAVRTGYLYAVDGSAYFSRPGPRLIDGLEILAGLLRNNLSGLPLQSVQKIN